MTYITIYCTTDTQDSAKSIITDLLEKHLVACGNIFQPHTAIFRWEGKVETEQETAFILKTREDLFEETRATIVEKHPYDCPCIIATPIMQGHNPFLKFIEAETDELLRP